MMSNGQRDGDFEHRDTQQKRKVVCDEERTMKGMKEGQGEGHRIWPEKKKKIFHTNKATTYSILRLAQQQWGIRWG